MPLPRTSRFLRQNSHIILAIRNKARHTSILLHFPSLNAIGNLKTFPRIVHPLQRVRKRSIYFSCQVYRSLLNILHSRVNYQNSSHKLSRCFYAQLYTHSKFYTSISFNKICWQYSIIYINYSSRGRTIRYPHGPHWRIPVELHLSCLMSMVCPTNNLFWRIFFLQAASRRR